MILTHGYVVLKDTMVNQQIGIGDHWTQALLSNDKVNIKITLQGIGTNSPFTRPHGELSQIEDIPEFGLCP